jgi:pyridoxamine 5'-phosphate oxidase
LDREAAFPSELADGKAIPNSFELVRIEVQAVELLELTGHPHQRRRWCADQHWAEERLNP